MEYEGKIKKIGGSCYLLVPPKLAKSQRFKNGEKITFKESGEALMLENNKNKNLDKYALDFLNLSFDLGGETITREEIYETDRY